MNKIEYNKFVQIPPKAIIVCIPQEKKYLYNNIKFSTMNKLINHIILNHS